MWHVFLCAAARCDRHRHRRPLTAPCARCRCSAVPLPQETITAESRAYIAKHPQLQQLLHDFTTAV